MDRQSVIKELKKYFGINELVCNHTIGRFGEEVSWQFLDTELLETLLILRRDVFKVPMTVNHDGLYQRGLRCNICQLVQDKSKKNQIYLSAHVNGAGIDFDVQGMSAMQARVMIEDHARLLPYRIRLEANVSWVHLDIYDNQISNAKISYFKG